MDKFLRQPYEGELDYFKKNPEVSGMATEDNRIILNPYSNLSEQEKNSVIKNEFSRLLIRNKKVEAPKFEITQKQKDFFKNTPYAENEDLMRQTIAARVFSGDPSAQDFTEEQLQYAAMLQDAMDAEYAK